MYSISVDWETEFEEWQNIGQNYLKEFFEMHPEEAEDEGCEFMDELLSSYEPITNYAYPLQYDPILVEDGEERIVKVCRETNLTVMYKDTDDCYYLALTGWGRDFSQDIARAYQIMEDGLPVALLGEVSRDDSYLLTFPERYRKHLELSVHGEAWLEMAEQIQKQTILEINNLQDSLKRWGESIAEYKAKVT